MRGSRNYLQGGPGQSDKKALKIFGFSCSSGGPTFSRGAQLFPGGPIAYFL